MSAFRIFPDIALSVSQRDVALVVSSAQRQRNDMIDRAWVRFAETFFTDVASLLPQPQVSQELGADPAARRAQFPRSSCEFVNALHSRVSCPPSFSFRRFRRSITCGPLPFGLSDFRSISYLISVKAFATPARAYPSFAHMASVALRAGKVAKGAFRLRLFPRNDLWYGVISHSPRLHRGVSVRAPETAGTVLGVRILAGAEA